MASKKKELKPILCEDFYSISTVEDPQVHPNGHLISYVRVDPEREGKSYSRSIWLVDRRRGKPRQFTVGGKKGDFAPRWSPDGKKLAFVSLRGGKPQIYIIPLNGGEALPFTSMANGAGMPVWSPDGKFIAFTSRTRQEERDQEDKPRRKPKKPLDERAAKRLEEHIYSAGEGRSCPTPDQWSL